MLLVHEEEARPLLLLLPENRNVEGVSASAAKTVASMTNCVAACRATIGGCTGGGGDDVIAGRCSSLSAPSGVSGRRRSVASGEDVGSVDGNSRAVANRWNEVSTEAAFDERGWVAARDDGKGGNSLTFAASSSRDDREPVQSLGDGEDNERFVVVVVVDVEGDGVVAAVVTVG